jgi:hypothetical protein
MRLRILFQHSSHPRSEAQNPKSSGLLFDRGCDEIGPAQSCGQFERDVSEDNQAEARFALDEVVECAPFDDQKNGRLVGDRGGHAGRSVQESKLAKYLAAAHVGDRKRFVIEMDANLSAHDDVRLVAHVAFDENRFTRPVESLNEQARDLAEFPFTQPGEE